MSEEPKTEGNGKLTDEALLAISDIDIKDTKKYCNEDRDRRKKLLESACLDRFHKDPDSFIEKSELICGAVRTDLSALGLCLIIGNAKRSELDIAQSELNTRIDIVRRQLISLEAGKIVPAKGSMFNFARRKK